MIASKKSSLLKYTFQLLVLFLPTQLALHFWPKWAYVYGFRLDYLSPTIFFTDILLLFLFIFWITKNFHRLKNLFHKSEKTKKGAILVFLTWFMLANVYFAQSFPISFLKWVKIFEIAFVSLFIATEKDFNISDWLIKPLMLSLFIVSLITFGQFILQKTIGGPLYLIGERSFTASTPGISRFALWGREFLRPYATFPHPNVLGGFVATSFFLLLYGARKNLKRTLLFKLSLILIFISLIFSVSHAAWISFALILFIFFLTLKSETLFKRFYTSILVSIIAISLLLPIVSVRLLSSFNYPEEISRRLVLSKAAGIIIAKNPLIGIGAGNFVLKLVDIAGVPKVSWWLQPVHNVFLLTFSEMGLLGLGVFLLLIITLTRRMLLQKEIPVFLSASFLMIIFTGAADHYWLTLQQTQLLSGVVMGLILRNKSVKTFSSS